MEKVFKPKPELGELGKKIADLENEEKHRLKVREFLKLEKPNDYVYKGIKIHIKEISEENGLLKIRAYAERGGFQIPLDNPFYFQNPPIMVPDGTFHKEKIGGEEFEVHNFKEDLEEALKEFLGQVIEYQAQRRSDANTDSIS